MSKFMKTQASYGASFRAMVWKQLFHRVPQLPPHTSLKGKTAIVTGASRGLGFECARQFLQVGASKVILAVRDGRGGAAAQKKLLSEFPQAKIETWIVDMESNDSIRQFAAQCEELDRLDVAVLNAGCGKATYQKAVTGREVTLQVNYLGTALLSLLLIPILRKTRVNDGEKGTPGRLTIVTSDISSLVKLEEPSIELLDYVDKAEGYDGMEQYGRTKLLINMFVAKLAEEGAVDADDVIVNAVNPAAVKGTDIMRDSKGHYLVQTIVFFNELFFGRNLKDGTRQYLHAALVLDKESHGSYVDFAIRPYPPIMYSYIGQHLMHSLWDETLRELKIEGI